MRENKVQQAENKISSETLKTKQCTATDLETELVPTRIRNLPQSRRNARKQ